MNTSEIAAARAACEAATAGPWRCDVDIFDPDEPIVCVTIDDPSLDMLFSSQTEFVGGSRASEAKCGQEWRDAVFIAGSRQWLPQALDALEEARAELGIAKAQASEAVSNNESLRTALELERQEVDRLRRALQQK